MPDAAPLIPTPASDAGPQTPRDRVLPGALRIERLALEVAGKPLVNIERLVLDPRSVTVIMGPNGAGKSLFLRLVHGLIAPTRGWISWGEVACGEATRSTQAMVFQKPVLLRRSVAANIDFVLRRRSGTKPERRARCEELLTRVGLADRAQQPARLLSGGEQQRLALARALATRPKVLLLDEPTASLDPASVQMIEQIVLASSADQTKVIFVTHDVGQARRLAGDVAFLHHGQLVEHRPAAAFFATPSSEAAKAYLSGNIVL
ncbi:ATP-binding cassette domain-containing protein [Hoeflea sp. AS60]|uniref:ATP-binding cassette domain-containing protein n=1 Tax=Hoeflea sp. AS60 TaxID=3135780 RepID=UPI00317D3722